MQFSENLNRNFNNKSCQCYSIKQIDNNNLFFLVYTLIDRGNDVNMFKTLQ